MCVKYTNHTFQFYIGLEHYLNFLHYPDMVKNYFCYKIFHNVMFMYY